MFDRLMLFLEWATGASMLLVFLMLMALSVLSAWDRRRERRKPIPGRRGGRLRA